MKGLTELTATELSDIYRRRTKTSLIIASDVTEFKKHAPDVEFQHPLEVPPTSASLSPEILAQAALKPIGNDQDKYHRLVLFVYAHGGRIWYRELESGDYQADIAWPDP